MKEIQDDFKNLVSNAVKTLGISLKDIYGIKVYNKIEQIRLEMKSIRDKQASVVELELTKVYKKLSKSTDEELHEIAKAFSLMLELINACESAYRTYRLRDYQLEANNVSDSLIYVFTGHPTESRSQNFLLLMKRIEGLLIQALKNDFLDIKDELLHLLRLATQIDIANNRRPKVKDEMDQIFHTVLDPAIVSEQVYLRKKGINVLFRTWVGGDKDGHPGVNYKTMIESLIITRKKLLNIIDTKLKKYESELNLVKADAVLLESFSEFKKHLKKLSKIEKDDGMKIKSFHKSLSDILKVSEKFKLQSTDLISVKEIVWLYPALVLPLEIREDSELIHIALKNENAPISKMLKTLYKISNGFEAKWYVRGFVISMCMETKDLLAAAKLTKTLLHGYKIPVVPLFENEKGLTNARKILTESFEKFPFYKEHKSRWGGKFEVMLGYSDSSKENGVMPARLMVEKGILEIDECIKKLSLRPVFFHGSGGSTSRGGGPVQDQIAWWPKSALDIFKVTIQGEMVQRNFNRPLILRSQVGKIIKAQENFKIRNFKYSKDLKTFTDLIQEKYKTLVQNTLFQELVSDATPYNYLNFLKIGSRPSKRAGKATFSLRAIPWILCWTQTRLLLPVWWGLGSSWKSLDSSKKNNIIKDYKNSPLLQTYIKNLGFTLAKVELGVWNFHLDNSDHDKAQKQYWKKTITDELNLSIKFFEEITGEKNLTWYRPWLRESIYFRSSMIHPLNAIQKIALDRKDRKLLRETVTGIACGMLTTG